MSVLKEEVKAKWKFSKGGGRNESNLLVRNLSPQDKIIANCIYNCEHACVPRSATHFSRSTKELIFKGWGVTFIFFLSLFFKKNLKLKATCLLMIKPLCWGTKSLKLDASQRQGSCLFYPLVVALILSTVPGL